jgi:peptidoglycan hydrolase-like protein with peptidoglycan-binding domain
MTTANLAHLPIQFGGTLLASAGRLAMMAASRYLKAPLANTGIAALVGISALAASNAMYFQPHAHPAPLFGGITEADAQPTKAIEPVIPLSRPADLRYAPPVMKKAEAPVARPAADLADDSGPVGNTEVFEVQRKLEMLRLFSGTIDGYYGPQTARAIRKFQELVGLKPTGELTREVVERVRDAPMTLGDAGGPPASPAATAMPKPLAAVPAEPVEPAGEGRTLPVTTPMSSAEPAPEPLMVLPDLPAEGQGKAAVDPRTLAELPPLQTPAPLVAEIETGSIRTKAAVKDAPPTVLGRPVPTSAEGALQMASDTAGEAIDTIIAGVEAFAAARPAEPKPTTLIPATKPAPTVTAKTETAPANAAVEVATVEKTPARPAAAAGASTDRAFVAKVQRGLASLGFLQGPADGVAGEATARAIRNFEVYFNYQVTGSVSPGLLDLLVQNGASI